MSDIYIIGDTHGCLHTLDHLLFAIIKPREEDHLIFLGDLVNKGPDSKGVLDRFMQLKSENIRVDSVRGNHDQMFLEAREGGEKWTTFLGNGGEETLASFGVDNMTDIPNEYFTLLESFPFFLELDDFFIVHGGFNCDIDDPFSDIDAMLSIRNFRYDSRKLRNKRVIHGHKAIPLRGILESLIEKKNMVYNIDNGCVYSGREGMGNLIGLKLNDFSYHIQPNIE